MPDTPVHSRLTAVYAQGLFDAAVGHEAADAVRADVESLRQLIGQYPEFAELLADPRVGDAELEKVIRRTFEGKVHPYTLNFLLVLNQRFRLGQLAAILEDYVALDDRQRLHRREVEVVSAVPLDGSLLEQIRCSIQAWGGFEPIVRTRQDPDLLGGLVIRIGDQQIDASVRGQLERLRDRLKESMSMRVAERTGQPA